MTTKNSLNLSIDALSKSLKIDKDEAKEHFSQAFEYKSWQSLCDDVEKQSSKLCNIKSNDILNEYIAMLGGYFYSIFQLDEESSYKLAKSVEPFSGKDPKPYRIDLDLLRKQSNDDLNLNEVFNSLGGNDGILEFMKNVSSEIPELNDFLNEIESGEELSDGLRISMPIDPVDYFNAVSTCTNWYINDNDFASEYELLSPSFHLQFKGDMIPVLLFSYITTPGDNTDELHAKIKDDISQEWEKALLLTKYPVFKEIDGDRYACIGYYLKDDSWSPVLLCNIHPEVQHDLINSENTDLESPPLGDSFVVQDNSGYPEDLIYYLILAGHYEDDKLKVPNEMASLSNVSGWNQFML